MKGSSARLPARTRKKWKARRRRRSVSELASVMMGQKLQGGDAEKVGALFPDLGGEVTQAAAVCV